MKIITKRSKSYSDVLSGASTLIIHPGFGKTGTSAIQDFLFHFNKYSEHHSVFCPFGIAGGAHNLLATNHPLFDQYVFNEILEKTIEFTLKRESPTIISTEFFIRQSPPDTVKLLKTLMHHGITVKVVIGIRNYRDYMLSSYLQALKVKWGMRENETLEDYINRELPQVRFPFSISPWSDVLGNDSIFLFNFDVDRSNYLRKFLTFIGIGSSPEYVFSSNIIVNHSIPLPAIGILNEFDAASADSKARQGLLDLLMTVNFKDDSSDRYYRFAEEMTGDIYESDYYFLSEKFAFVE